MPLDQLHLVSGTTLYDVHVYANMLLVGFDFNAIQDKNNEWVLRYNTVMSSAFDVSYLMFPSLDSWLLPFNPPRKHKHAEADKFLGMIDQIILEKRKTLQNKSSTPEEQDEEKDLLTMMIEAGRSGQGGLTNEELRVSDSIGHSILKMIFICVMQNDVVVFFIAGHDTTANALSTVLYELAKNQVGKYNDQCYNVTNVKIQCQDVQAKARQEAIKVLGEASENVVPTAEQMNQMKYINMVIKEVYKEAWVIGEFSF